MTNAIVFAMRRIVAELDVLPADWALVGGFAVSARSEPRFTRDVDVCVAVGDDSGAERVVAALTTHGYRLHAPTPQSGSSSNVATTEAATSLGC